MKRIYYLLFFLMVFLFSITSHAQWKRTSTGLFSGNSIYSLLYIDGKLIAGTPDGVFTSTDEGTNWDSSSTGLPIPYGSYYASVNSMYYDGTTLYAGTAGQGIYSSTNEGATWDSLGTGLPDYATINCLTKSGSVLIAGLAYGGIYRSTDNGAQWIDANTGITTTGTFNSFVSTSAGVFAGTSLHGVYLSTDHGASWTGVNNGLPTNAAIYSLVTNGTDLYVGYIAAVYHSSDNGASWTSISNGLPSGKLINTLVLDGTTIYAGTSGAGIYVTTNGGATWSADNSGIASSSEVLLLSMKDSDIIASISNGTTDKLFISTDNGATWVNKSSLPMDAGIDKMSVSGNNLYVGTTNFGLLRTSDNGAHWDVTAYPSNVRTLYATGNNIYASVYIVATDTIAYKSTDNGVTWTAMTTTMGLSGEGLFSFVMSDTNLLAGTGTNTSSSGIYVSTNQGAHWAKFNTGLPGIYPGAMALIVKGSRTFAGVSCYSGTSGVYVSTNNGGSWSGAHTGLPSSPATAFALVDSTLYALLNGGTLFKTTNNGASWDTASNGLPQYASISSMVSVGSSVVITVGGTGSSSTDGVYVSSNGGASWTVSNEGLPDPSSVNQLAVNDSFLFVSVSGYGVYKRSLSEIVTGVREISNGVLPANFQLEQNYPNPFNPTTNFDFRIAKSGLVTLKIYNILGEEVATLLNERKGPGEYIATWNAGSAPSGVYYYRISTANFTETKAMILMK